MQDRASVTFLGSRFHNDTIEEAGDAILGGSLGRFRYVVTPNVQHIVKLHETPETLRPLHEGAWRVYCDSRVLAGLSRLSGGPRLSVITGSDLTAHLIQRASVSGIKVAVIGPSPADCALLAKRYPGLDYVLHTPPMGFVKSEPEMTRCIDFVVSTAAPLVFLAVGMPQQEILAGRIAADPRATGVGLCIGASIDFLTGKQQRAPRWMQTAGLEWLHRLATNPRRLASRYLIECPKIFYLLLAHRRAA